MAGTQKFITRACDACRKRKIRCEPTRDACQQCIKSNTRCHFTPISGTRKVRKPAENEYISELEERVKKLEGQLEVTQKVNSHARSPPHELLSGLHQLPSPEGSLWSQSWDTAPSHAGHLDLPPQPYALELIEEAFRSFLRHYPIFDEQKFMKSFDTSYSTAGFQDPTWWASVNVALSLGHIFRAVRSPEHDEQDAAFSLGYMQNVLGIISQLMALPQSLPAIQALLGTILILEGTPSAHMVPVLIATAMAMVQAMGLHRRDRDPPGLSLSEVEERRSAFWIAYFLEKNTSFLRRRASVFDDDDMDVELPIGTMSSPPLLNCPANVQTINILHSRIGLAIIQRQIYRQLLSLPAQRQSEQQRAEAAHDIHLMLSCWRNNSLPFGLKEETIATLPFPLPEDVLQIIVLHTAYTHSLITVDQYLPREPSSDMPENQAESFKFTIAERSCAKDGAVYNALDESRKVAQLLSKMPCGSHALFWLLAGSLFEAVKFLLQNAARNPTHVQARSDVLLVEPFLEVLRALDDGGEREELRRMRDECNGLVHDAIEAVRGAEDAMVS